MRWILDGRASKLMIDGGGIEVIYCVGYRLDILG